MKSILLLAGLLVVASFTFLQHPLLIFAAQPPCPPASSQIDGFFSSDGNFKVKTTGLSNDKMLVIGGAVIVNAARNGGQFLQQRDLGSANNGIEPAVTFQERPDMILNSPSLLGARNYFYQELAP